jgi:hypothetical protein
MSKQTAVQWLESQLLKQKSILKNHFEEGKWNDDRCSEIDNCLLFIQQAKEMEKQQKANTWNNAINAVEKDKWESFEQYYEQTYGDNK